MKERRKDIEQVEELDHFPFDSFREFREGRAQGVYLTIDHAIALDWISQRGYHSPKGARNYATALALIPYLAFLGFIGFSIVTGAWIQLLWIPVIIVAFFIFHPSGRMMWGPIRSALIALVIIGLVYSLFSGPTWLAALTLTLTALWYVQKKLYAHAIRSAVQAMDRHEDLLCHLWQGGHVSVILPNGNRYWVFGKDEDGESTHYED